MSKVADEKLTEACGLLDEAWHAFQKQPKSRVIFAAVAKAFEVAFEYAWKCFKREGDKTGMEIYSPRDALKAAAQLGLIDNLELWSDFLNARNLSVHDYVGIDDRESIALIGKFRSELKRLLAKQAQK